uniref:60S ribosomal protein L22-like 1 n=1 Tax=Moschus moschiferus TaxID=68415 RepID=A0A8C6DNM7_MOSMO
MAPKKDKKLKKSTWKFNLDLTHPVEDGISDSGNFEQTQGKQGHARHCICFQIPCPASEGKED